jgi:hypothetical protein
MAVYTLETSDTNIVDAAGLAKLQYAIVDGDGCPMGPSGTIAQGAYRGMGVHIAARKAGGAIPEPRIVNSSGDDGAYLQQFIFQPPELSKIDLTFGAFNMDFLAAVQGLSTFAVGDWTGVGVEHHPGLFAVIRRHRFWRGGLERRRAIDQNNGLHRCGGDQNRSSECGADCRAARGRVIRGIRSRLIDRDLGD